MSPSKDFFAKSREPTQEESALSARGRPEGSQAYGFGWVQGEPGLERPG